MDRLPTLSALAALALLAGACGDDAEPAPVASSARFEGVAAAPSGVDAALAELCDVHHPAESAPRFSFPPLAGEAALAPEGWTWVNYWATWCKPCVEELPMLFERLSEGPIALVTVSADVDGAPVEAFRAEHGLAVSSARLEEPTGLGASLAGLGFGAPPSLPVHVLVDPAGGARCVRAGAVEARHVDAVREALGAEGRAPRIR